MAELFRFFWLYIKNSFRPWLRERVSTGIQSVYNRKVGVAILSSGALFLVVQLYFYNREQRKRRISLRNYNFEASEASSSSLDVVIVGAGPAGTACAYYLASCGVRVVVLEKCTFPRDKICGDVIVPPVQSILKEMGVWQRLTERGCFRWLNVAAVLGESDSSSVVGRMRTGRNAAVQRIVLDEEMMWAARGAGAVVEENHNVVSAGFSAVSKRWLIECENGRSFAATFLIAADGASSHISKMLGVITDPPNASGTRSYIRPEDTGSFNADLVIRCCTDGPAALVREAEDYVLVTSISLAEINPVRERESMIDLVKVALNNGAQLSRAVSCEMRVGGVSKCSDVQSQFLAIGDAAGHCDPLSGLGLYPGMLAAKAASDTIVEALLSETHSIAHFQTRINRQVHVEFGLSSITARLIRRYPSLIDATIALCKNRGALFLSDIVGGLTHDKFRLLSVDVSLMIVLQCVWNLFSVVE